MKKTIIVEGMSCQHCVMAVKRALGELEGVKSVDVFLADKKVEVEVENTPDEKLREAISDAGYDVVEIR
jgi:copper chaperone